MSQFSAEYFGILMDPRFFESHIERAAQLAQSSGVEFDAVAFTGVSGALTGPIMAYILNKPMIVVRKEDDKSTHSPLRVEGDVEARRFIFVDDFISTGTTMQRVISAVRRWSGADCVGAIEVKYLSPRKERECFSYVRVLDPALGMTRWEYIPNLAYQKEKDDATHVHVQSPERVQACPAYS